MLLKSSISGTNSDYDGQVSSMDAQKYFCLVKLVGERHFSCSKKKQKYFIYHRLMTPTP